MKAKLPYATELPVSNAVPVARTHDECPRVFDIDGLIFTATVATPMLILQLPMTFIDGRPVPTVIFGGQQYAFQAFLLCLVGACSGSVYSILFRENRPKIAGVFRAYALFCMATSAAIFLGAAAYSGFRSWLR